MQIVTVRASAFSDMLDCPARFEAKHILGKRCPTSPNALLGKAVHRSTAVFDESTISGKGIKVGEAAAAAVDEIHKPTEEVAYTESDMNPAELEHVALSLHSRYCTEVAPHQEYAAVEVKCERLEITDIGLALTGTTDRIRKVENGHGISDLKTGKAAVRADGRVETKGHRYQIGIYELLAEKASGIPITAPGQIIGLQVAKTDRGQRAGVSEGIEHARDVLIGDAESPGVLEVVAHQIHAGIFPGNPRSMMCHEKYCPVYNTCKFRK